MFQSCFEDNLHVLTLTQLHFPKVDRMIAVLEKIVEKLSAITCTITVGRLD